VDGFQFHDRKSTLWGWAGQNPLRWRDPSGHYKFFQDGPTDAPTAAQAVETAEEAEAVETVVPAVAAAGLVVTVAIVGGYTAVINGPST
jgi:hypothetical protein